MTIVSILSLKGAPGVTTLSCLLAASWPTSGDVLVVEADPAGGDLAARFGLSATLGCSSLTAAVRRAGPAIPLAPHLQYLPGGLAVMVGSPDDAPASEVRRVAEAIGTAMSGGLVVVDLGRWVPGSSLPDVWLDRSDAAVVVLRGDAAAAVRVRNQAPQLVAATGGNLGVVVVGADEHDCLEVASFTGIRALGDVPFDPRSAGVASGVSSAVRRLGRSSLLASVRRIAEELAEIIESSEGGPRIPSAGWDPQAVPTEGGRGGPRWFQRIRAASGDPVERTTSPVTADVGSDPVAGVR